jgi:hypothetical protein
LPTRNDEEAYFVQQAIDLAFWIFGVPGGAKKETGYHTGTAAHVAEYFENDGAKTALRQHIRFRTSCVVLLYGVAEVSAVAGLVAYFTQNNLRRAGLLLFGVGLVLFCGAVWQNLLTRLIEGRVVAQPRSGS